jgi:hypothetical protein
MLDTTKMGIHYVLPAFLLVINIRILILVTAAYQTIFYKIQLNAHHAYLIVNNVPIKILAIFV